jgi:hypothetical protein
LAEAKTVASALDAGNDVPAIQAIKDCGLVFMESVEENRATSRDSNAILPNLTLHYVEKDGKVVLSGADISSH